MARMLKPCGVAGFGELGRLHSQTPMSQKEMAEYDVPENDLVLEDAVALAYSAGFTDFTRKLSCGEELTLGEYAALVTRTPAIALELRTGSSIAATMENKSIFFLQKGIRQIGSRGLMGSAARLRLTLTK